MRTILIALLLLLLAVPAGAGGKGKGGGPFLGAGSGGAGAAGTGSETKHASSTGGFTAFHCARWDAEGDDLESAGDLCGVAGGEANVLDSPDVGTDIELINTVPKSAPALNLKSLAAEDFTIVDTNIIEIDWTDANIDGSLERDEVCGNADLDVNCLFQAESIDSGEIIETDTYQFSGANSTLQNFTIDGLDGGVSTTRAAGSNIIAHRAHNTDCTLLTDGKRGEFCIQDSDQAVFICLPSAGDCSGGEWLPILDNDAAEVNNLGVAVTWADVPDANITEGSVTQHEGAISHDALADHAADQHLVWGTSGVGTLHEDNFDDTAAYTLSGASTVTNHTIAGGDSGVTTTRGTGSNIVTVSTHNNDCQNRTDGKQGEICQDEDDGHVFICQPIAGDCSGGEWIDISTFLPLNFVLDGTTVTATAAHLNALKDGGEITLHSHAGATDTGPIPDCTGTQLQAKDGCVEQAAVGNTATLWPVIAHTIESHSGTSVTATELNLLDTMTGRGGLDLILMTGDSTSSPDDCVKFNSDGDLVTHGSGCGGGSGEINTISGAEGEIDLIHSSGKQTFDLRLVDFDDVHFLLNSDIVEIVDDGHSHGQSSLTVNVDDIAEDTVDDTALDVAAGGTGVKTLTNTGVLLGGGSTDIDALVILNAQLLIGQTTADPQSLAVSGDMTMDNSGAFTLDDDDTARANIGLAIGTDIPILAHTIESHASTGATGAELESLTGGGDADTEHRHTLEADLTDPVFLNTMAIPVNGTVNSSGELSIDDSNAGQLVFADATNPRYLNAEQELCKSLESAQASDTDVLFMSWRRPVKIQAVACIKEGSTPTIAAFEDTSGSGQIGTVPTCADVGSQVYQDVSGDADGTLVAGEGVKFDIGTGADNGSWTTICVTWLWLVQ